MGCVPRVDVMAITDHGCRSASQVRVQDAAQLQQRNIYLEGELKLRSSTYLLGRIVGHDPQNNCEPACLHRLQNAVSEGKEHTNAPIALVFRNLRARRMRGRRGQARTRRPQLPGLKLSPPPPRERGQWVLEDQAGAGGEVRACLGKRPRVKPQPATQPRSSF
jgi:hypothetical protein